MSTSASSTTLTSEECELLLSLPDSELEEFLRKLSTERQQTVIAEITAYRTPTERATESLHEFVRQAWHIVEPDQPFIDGWHIQGICLHLEAIANGKFKSLLVNVPPGACKSRLCNVFFPAWVWSRNPSARFFHASYGQELSTRDSVACRYIVESRWYQERWGSKVKIVEDQNQKTRFDTTERGWRIASSVGGRGTGEHPDFILCDDPITSVNAQSAVARQSVIDWWDGTISTRGMVRNSACIVIMQRLHENDLSGHILKRGGYEHICLPMEWEPNRMVPTCLGWSDPRRNPGELLWPEGIPPAMVEERKLRLGPWQVPGQFQQRPTKQGGGVIQTEKIQIVDALPNGCHRFVRYWDKAATAGAGDFTAGAILSHCDGITYVADMVRGQWEYETRNQRMEQTAALDAERFGEFEVTIWGEQEGGSGGKESAGLTVRRLARYSVRMERVTGSKVERAGPFAGQVNAGNVRLLRGPWNLAYLEELSTFPVGDHDDQVDASSGAYNKLMGTGFGPPRINRNIIIDLNGSTEGVPYGPEPSAEMEFSRRQGDYLADLAARLDAEDE